MTGSSSSPASTITLMALVGRGQPESDESSTPSLDLPQPAATCGYEFKGWLRLKREPGPVLRPSAPKMKDLSRVVKNKGSLGLALPSRRESGSQARLGGRYACQLMMACLITLTPFPSSQCRPLLNGQTNRHASLAHYIPRGTSPLCINQQRQGLELAKWLSG